MTLEEQYKAISKEIEEENQSEMDFLISSLAAAITNDSSTKNDDSEEERNHLENITALLSLRVAVAIPLINNGMTEWQTQLEEDINVILEKICSIEYEWELNDDIITHFADLITVISPNNRETIKLILKNRYKHRFRRTKEISSGLFSLFISVALAFQRLNKPDLFSAVLEGLCNISRERNNKTLHREIVSNVFAVIGDVSPETIIKIGRQNTKYFDRATDDFARDFFWFYGWAFEQTGNNSEAVLNFQKCYEIRRALSGEDDWYTAISRREFTILSYPVSREQADFDYLLEFIDKIEKGIFNDVDIDTLKIIEGKTLYIMLVVQAEVNGLERNEHLIEKYSEICDLYDTTPEPLLKKRLAENLKGLLYTQQENYILAEEAFREAIAAKLPEGVGDIITEEQIESNLLLIYDVQNDLDMAMPVIARLLKALDDESYNSGLTESDEMRIYSFMMDIAAQRNLYLNIEDMDDDEVEEAKASIKECCEKILCLSDELPEDKNEFAMFVMGFSSLMLQAENSTKEELTLYLDALDKIRREYMVFQLDKVQNAILIHISALLAWTVEDSRTGRYFDNVFALFNEDESAIPLSTKSAMMISYSTYAAVNENYKIATQCLVQAMEQMEKSWKNYVRYLNDDRLIQILEPTQLQFASVYAILRTIENCSTAYEYILQFKALASFASKERNRILNSAHIDQDLLDEIHKAQDRIAALEIESQVRDISFEYEKEQIALRTLEAQFAQRFPSQDNFISITWDTVKDAIPDESVVVEYYYCAFEYGRRQFDGNSSEPKMGLDIFITQKHHGECKLTKLVVEDSEDLLSLSDEFVEILQAESNGNVTLEQVSKLDELREILFKSLVKLALPYLEGFETVYIAPDLNLTNLPFEILYDDEYEAIGEEHNVIKIECARDFLFVRKPDNTDGGSLIIGDPQYDIRDKDLGTRDDDSNNNNRLLNLKSTQIKSLPCSKIEAKQIGRHLNSNYYIGFTATKYLLSKKTDYRNIHLATHGYFDLSESGSSMYSSCLLFAGVNNWLRDGKSSSIYGNGILTADEISRMDCKNAELVVLSSCLSGMSDISVSKGFQGMISAFSAAGAHYVISHLWEADDFSTAVFMDAFYYQYAEKGKEPPKALNLAKTYMRNVTIGDLRKAHWFENMRSINNSGTVSSALEYEKMDDEVRPFRNEAFWGGFTCYQCY